MSGSILPTFVGNRKTKLKRGIFARTALKIALSKGKCPIAVFPVVQAETTEQKKKEKQQIKKTAI